MDDAMRELGRRAIAAGWRWMPGCADQNGQRVTRVVRHMNGTDVEAWDARAFGWTSAESFIADDIPDFSDPATRGCLEHQVRERFDTRVWIKWWPAFAPDMSGRDRSWCEAVDGMGRRLIAGPAVEHRDEVSAWLAALEAAPTEVT